MSHHDRQHARRNVRCVLCTPHRHGNAAWGLRHRDRKMIAGACNRQRTRTRRRNGAKYQEYIDMLREECPNPNHGGYPWGPYLRIPRSGRSDLVWCWVCDLVMPRILKAREG